MDEKYLPKTTPKKLAHLIEECGEVMHAVGKALRFGLDKSLHPHGESNREWILRELDDLQLAILAVRVALDDVEKSPE
jgi:NTP pyrophosphatase (non-canonical NTP hydrolase)